MLCVSQGQSFCPPLRAVQIQEYTPRIVLSLGWHIPEPTFELKQEQSGPTRQ